jgi:hypothetical protein
LPAKLPPTLLSRHRTFNRNSEGRWDAFASHRAAVMKLILEAAAARPSGRIAVLGAGNCNDLELPPLLAAAAELHLADVDDEALAKAPLRQECGGAPNLFLHAPVDLTGVLAELPAFAKRRASADDLVALGERASAGLTGQLPGPFDVVVSAALLSQIMHSCRLALGAEHPDLADLAHTLVLAHLRTIVALTARGGRTLLVTDTASSATYPLVELFDAERPLALLDDLERANNLLSGTAPSYLRRLVAKDEVLRAELLGPARMVPPWLWDLGDELTLLAYALVLSRAP